MKKFFTLISMLCLCAFNAMAANYVLDKELSWDDVKGGEQAFALVSGDKVLFGKDAQNAGFDVAANALAETNAAITWKVETNELGVLFHAYTPAGESYVIWGGSWLNSQPAIGSATFILGNAGKNNDTGETWEGGQDMTNGAIWTVAAVEGGYSIQNVGNNGYLSGLSTTEAAENVWKFYSVKEDASGEVAPKKSDFVLDKELSWDEVKAGEQGFALVSGDKILFGKDAQNAGFDAVDKALVKTNAAITWKVETNELGVLFHAYTPAGESYVIWGGSWLNSQPAIGSATFILGNAGKNNDTGETWEGGQDMTNGAIWTVAAVEGGYSIQNVGNNGYLSGLSTTEAADNVWKFYSIKEATGEEEPAEDPKPAVTVPEGCVDVAALTGTFADWATTVVYPKEFAVQGAAFGDGNGDKESTHVSVADYDKVTFVVSKGSTQGLALRVWMWNGSSVVTLFAQPEANEATADYSQEYLIKEPGNYVVKFNGLTDLKGVKAQNNWGADPITVDLAYVTPKSGEVTTAIKAVKKAEKKAVKKVLVNNQLVIVKGNDKFNVAGQLVK